jgi:phosphotransferase system HPr (HPr) family protein
MKCSFNLLNWDMTGITNNDPSTLAKKVQIINELGLHARAATAIAKIAQSATSPIWIMKDRNTADASSIIDILTLECTKGSWITLQSENPADHHLLIRIHDCVESGFGE